MVYLTSGGKPVAYFLVNDSFGSDKLKGIIDNSTSLLLLRSSSLHEIAHAQRRSHANTLETHGREQMGYGVERKGKITFIFTEKLLKNRFNACGDWRYKSKRMNQ